MVHQLDAAQVETTFSPHRDHAYFQHIRRKIRWQLLIVYLTPLILLSVYFHYQYTISIREGIHNHLQSIAENQRNTVDLFLQERVANLRNALGSLPLDDPNLTASNLEWILASLRRDSTTFVDVGLFSPEGALVTYAGPHRSLLGRNYSGERWFRELSIKEGGFFISDVYLGFREQPHFVIAVQRAVEGQNWTLRASVDPKRFGEFVGRSHLMDEADAYIVNAEGKRQGKREPEHLPVQVPPRSSEVELIEHDRGGIDHLSAFAWLTETDWALVASLPSDRAYAAVFHARLVLVGIVLVALAAIVVIVSRTTDRLVRRLEKSNIARENLQHQLFSAAKLASVGEMAAGVAHEINNPLAIIHEEASMVKDLVNPEFRQELSPKELEERMSAILDATIRGRTITRKLLAFARQHEEEPEPTDVTVLLDRVLKVKETEFRVSNIEVVKEFAKELPLVRINRNQMDQVLLNLLNNASDAIDGKGFISVRTRLIDGSVHIEVEDTGCGMTSKVMEQVFFPFFTTKEVGSGTGLGLSISYGIIQSFGGTIKVRSEIGKGTTFTIVLPSSKKSQNQAEYIVVR